MRFLSGKTLGYYFLSAGLIFGMICFADTGGAKELPLLVELSEIGKAHDGKRVTVFGRVRSAEVKSGRRGSLHLEVVLGKGTHTLKVYSIRPVVTILDRGVIVQGIYHEQGRFAGISLEHFIVADAIVRDWSDSETTPSPSTDNNLGKDIIHESQ